MSSIPFAAFTTKSVHDVIRRQKQQEDGKYRGTGSSIGQSEGTAKKPNLGEMHNYNPLFMNWVWGMYNQYAPQAFQKNEELTKL